jgi:hypothetical protein
MNTEIIKLKPNILNPRQNEGTLFTNKFTILIPVYLLIRFGPNNKSAVTPLGCL